MQETFYQTADARRSLSDIRCRTPSIRQLMQDSLHQTADVGDTLPEGGCRGLTFRQRMPDSIEQTAGAGETLYEAVDAEVSLSDSECRTLSNSQVSGCRRLSIRQWMQFSLYQDSIYQTEDARLYDTADAG